MIRRSEMNHTLRMRIWSLLVKYTFPEDMFSDLFCLVYFCLVLNKTTPATSRVYPLPNNVCSTVRLAARPHAFRPCARQPRGCYFNLSLSSSRPSRNTSPARSPVTLTMTMTPIMMMQQPMTQMIEPEYLFVFVGSVQGIFSSSLCSPGLPTWGQVTHNLSSLPGLTSYFSDQLR